MSACAWPREKPSFSRCVSTASTTSIGAGARLFLSGVPEALSAGEFSYDVDATTLVVHDRDGAAAAAQVVVPTLTAAVELARRGILPGRGQ